jgi:hypothetical protein
MSIIFNLSLMENLSLFILFILFIQLQSCLAARQLLFRFFLGVTPLRGTVTSRVKSVSRKILKKIKIIT